MGSFQTEVVLKRCAIEILAAVDYLTEWLAFRMVCCCCLCPQCLRGKGAAREEGGPKGGGRRRSRGSTRSWPPQLVAPTGRVQQGWSD